MHDVAKGASNWIPNDTATQAQRLTDKYTAEIDGLVTTAKKELAKA